MDGILSNDQPAATRGIESRYWRERRQNPEPDTVEELPPLPPSVILWYPNQVDRRMEALTTELRRRVVEAEEPGVWPRPLVGALPIMLGLSLILWLILGKSVVVVGHLLGLL
jgi:hypothetical protein